MSPPFSTRSNAPQRAATRVAARLNAFKRNATRSRSGNRQLDSLSGSYPPEKDNWGLELLVKMPVAAKPTTSAQCIQDGSTVVRFSPSTKSATFRSIGCWLWSRVACQMRARSRYFHWRWPDDAYPSQSDMFEVFCCLSTTTKHTPICQTTWCSRSSWRWCFPGLTTAPQLLPAFQSNSWTGFSLFRTPLHGWSSDLQSLSSGPHSAVTAQITLASDARTRFVPAGSASVSLPPRLCTWLPGFRSSARHISHLITRRRRLRSSTTSALVAPRTVRFAIGDRTFPATAASVWNSLPESVRSSPSLQVFRSKLKTELFARSY